MNHGNGKTKVAQRDLKWRNIEPMNSYKPPTPEPPKQRRALTPAQTALLLIVVLLAIRLLVWSGN